MGDVIEVISVGSINADLVFSVERALRPGETLLSRDFLRTSGGKGANRAVQARRLGARARLFGCVGDDDLADRALAGPGSADVDVGGVGVASGPTGAAAILVEESGEKSIALAANANDSWPPDYAAGLADAVTAAPSGTIVAADLEVPALALGEVLRVAAERDLRVVLDPSPPDRVTPDLWSCVDHVTPNPNEAGRITGIEVTSVASAEAAGAELVARGARVAYVKLRSGGCVAVDAAGATVHEPPDVHVVDATGAGDAFAGTLAVGLAEGRPPPDAARLAVAAAACSVGRHGSQESYGNRSELERLARQVDRSTPTEVQTP